ncbi:hypothetical protein NMY22_g9850 [Coprinellus aureogranulatus]|nr:hypothetical protein NMY22_g9850 [Coprinellus aureogranulatus]
MPSISVHQYDNVKSVLDTIERQFTIADDTLVEITRRFLDEVKDGLDSYGKDMAMIPSFVTGVPDGTEKGRVCEVTLNGDKTFSLKQKKYKVSDTLKQGEASALFGALSIAALGYLQHSNAHFTGEERDRDSVYLGFTFSFPVEQHALDKGKLLTWTKGFSAKNAVGKDVVELLQQAFDRKHMHVKCVALVNDTVGTLLSRAYAAGGAVIGAIFGTGTNGAYVEDMENIKKLEGSAIAKKGGHMVINCEWGAFNNARTHLPMTPYDNILDRLSINPKYQTFEKFISGMYLGEILRLIILSLVDAVPEPLLFKGKSTSSLNEHYGIDTAFMSHVEEAWIGKGNSPEDHQLPPLHDFDESKLNDKVKPKLKVIKDAIVENLKLKPDDVSYRDAAIVRWLCALVANRAATLSSTAVAAILIQTGRARLRGDTSSPLKFPNEPTIGVGVDGSLVEHYPNFQDKIRTSLRFLVGEDVEKRVDIGLAKDGSGVGAALGALQAFKQL